jgi:hypothetical protein
VTAFASIPAQVQGPGAFETQDTVAYLLLLLLVKVIVLGGVFVAMSLVIVRQRRRSVVARAEARKASEKEKVFFGTPSRWLAVECSDSILVQAALGLKDTKPCSWDDGVYSDKAGQLFLAPPIDGWTLVFGPGLTSLADDPDRCFHFLRKISDELGTAQFFSTNPIVNHHCWALADEGDILRGYSWAGETVWNQGPITSAERDLGLVCFEYGQGSALDDSIEAHPALSNAERVHSLAGKWSLDPTAIHPRIWERQSGVAGFV